MNKKPLLAVLVVMICLLSGGCWDKKEFNKISFATAMAIDYVDGIYELTIKVMMPKSGEGGNLPIWVVSGSGCNIQDAMDNISKRSPREIYWGHMDVIILGESVLQSDMYQALDFFIRGSEFRRRNYCVVTEGKASDILDISPKLAEINNFYFKGLIEDQEIAVNRSAVTLNDVLLGLFGDGKDLLIPKLQLQENNEENTKDSNQAEEPAQGAEAEKKGDGSAGGESSGKLLELKGGALIKNERLVTWVDDEWVNGYNWINGDIRRGSIAIVHPEDADAFISFDIKKSECTIKIDRENPLRVTLIIKPTLNIGANTIHKHDTEVQMNSDALKVVKKAVEKEIKRQVEDTVVFAQKNNVDPFGIGRRIRAYYPKNYQQLDADNYMRDLDIAVEVNCDLKLALIIN